MADKSRKERRKETRVAKGKKKFDSWVKHQKSKPKKFKARKNNANMNPTVPSHLSIWGNDEQPQTLVNSESKRKDLKRKKDLSKIPESNLSKNVKMEMERRDLSADKDLKFEKKRVKKPKVNNGRLDENSHDEFSVDDMKDLDDEICSNDTEDSGDGVLVDEGSDEESDSLASSKEYDDDDGDDDEEVILPKDSDKVKRKKSKFEEYLEIDMEGGDNLAEVDLIMERKLAKKFKLKSGNVKGEEDDMNMLLDGIPSFDFQETENYPKKSVDKSVSRRKPNDPHQIEQPKAEPASKSVAQGKYVAPHLRSQGGSESEEHAQVRKRVRGLLNRLSEINVESITGEISTLIQSVGRSAGIQIISEEVVSSCSGGPRGNERYAAVFGAFVAGMACLVGIDFGAKLLARVAKCFEEEYVKEDNLSLRNLTLLLSYLYVFGICSSELIYDFLIMLGKRLAEVDVSTVLTILQCCGMKLRGDDPAGMKNFISSVQSRVNELKASSTDGQSNMIGKRMEFMLDTICNIKNNKQKAKEDTLQLTRIKKWLQKLRVDDKLIRAIKWSNLIDPNKKGQWWLSGDMASKTDTVEAVASKIDREIPETKKMLQLAASQRMNTDARRAIFCVIMSGEDYIDAFEKLQRLEFKGKQDREIMRVLVECCLQEKVFNKYYSVLAWRLCCHDKNHKFTLQYCLWDHFKDLESMTMIRSMHLSKFTAEMIASFSLSLSVLKTVDLNDPVQLTSKKIMHFRMLFEAIFEFTDKTVHDIFTRIALNPEYEALRTGIMFFITNYVVSNEKSLSSKFKIAKKALDSAESELI